MNPNAIRGLLGLAPTCALLLGAAVLHSRTKTTSSLLQLVGAGGLLVVLLTHVCEGLQLFSSMGWGDEHSAGHYLDLSSGLLGITLFPLGYLVHAFRTAVNSSRRMH